MGHTEEVEDRLKMIMNSWMPQIAPGCEPHLVQLIEKAAQRMDAEGFASNPMKLLEMEKNFRLLLTEMTMEAGVLGFRDLHEPTFFAAMNRLCPLFPFC